MSVIAGKEGSITFGAAAIAELTQWELTITPEYEARRVFGSDHMDRDSVGYDYTATAQGFYDATDTAQAAIVDAALVGTKTEVELLTGNGAVTPEDWTGTMTIEDIKVTQATANLVSFSVSLSGAGALVHTDPTDA